jgi:uncharacterized OsmC-like protein
MAGIRESIEAARKYLGQHPEEARYTDSAATARLESGLVIKVDAPDGSSIRTDMPVSVGGRGSAPSPGWVLRAAQASCLATLIAMRAAEEGMELTRLAVTVDSESDDRGILGMDESVPSGPLSSRLRVEMEATGAGRDELQSVLAWADTHCPVQDAVRRATPVRVELA